MSSIEKLTEQFLKFPGIGMRQARRFVYFLLRSEPAFLDALVSLLQTIKNDVAQCPSCRRFHESRGADLVCALCNDPHTDNTLLLVVEKDADLEAVKRGSAFNGRYFVLGGLLSATRDKKHAYLKDSELMQRIARDNGIQEVIFALSANPDGDNTVFYLKKQLEYIARKRPLRMTMLGRGISTGTEIEYSDTDTLSHALGNRKNL